MDKAQELAFLTELRDLLKKHNVEFWVGEEACGFGGYEQDYSHHIEVRSRFSVCDTLNLGFYYDLQTCEEQIAKLLG